MNGKSMSKGEALFWERHGKRKPVKIQLAEPHHKLKRHLRKYAEGELSETSSFYFTGPKNALNLRAQNLTLFVQIAQGVDDATWEHHLRHGDYSAWFRKYLKDKKLADEIAEIEADKRAPPQDSRARIKDAIERRYTGPAKGAA